MSDAAKSRLAYAIMWSMLTLSVVLRICGDEQRADVSFLAGGAAGMALAMIILL